MIGNAAVEDCEVEAIAVSAVKTTYEDSDGDGDIADTDGKIVGLGGFVGHAEGVTTYDLLSLGLDGVVDTLARLLNIIPGLGLGDLINVLLDNALDVGKLIPTGYTAPTITSSTVNNCTLSTYDGKYGVGGFAGSLVGTIVTDCTVKNCEMTVKAHHFGGGFAGVARDEIIEGTLTGLGVNFGILARLHPQTEIIRCSVMDSDMTVTGGWYLGGFAGVLANSYCINDTIGKTASYSGTVRMTVTGTKDFNGGFVGYARLGSLMSLGEYLPISADLLGTVRTLAANLLGSGGDQQLLDLGGVAPAAMLGCLIDVPLTVSSSDGSYVGGIVGRGDGCVISCSNAFYLRDLPKYKRKDRSTGDYINALPITDAEARDNHVTQLISVDAAHNYAGGIAGYLTTANVSSLLGDTVGVAQFLGFEVSYTYIDGIDDVTGYTVTALGDHAGGGIGLAAGGKVYDDDLPQLGSVMDVELTKLGSVTANNRAGGFVGTTGPGSLASGGGLDVSLLGLTLLKVSDLLKLISGIHTTYLRANVTGITAGYTVEETGMVTDQLIVYTAGGYAAEASSIRVVDCHANRLKSVVANAHDGIAGGFVARSTTGNLASLIDEGHVTGGNVLEIGQLLNAVPLLVPSYDGCDVNYVDGGFVQGDTAGGFAGDFMSGKVNTYTMTVKGAHTGINPIVSISTTTDKDNTYTYTVGNRTVPWSVNNIHHVRGGHYAGGWGGHVYPGALASAGGGLSLLGLVDTSSTAISADDLLGVADVYIPIIKYAGVNTATSNMATVSAAGGTTEVYEKVPTVHGFTVYAAYDYGATSNPATDGYAGGFIGYGQSVQISYSSVSKLAHGNVTEPDAFTPDDSSAYARIGIFPDELESQNGGNYINYSSNDPDRIPYAVAGAYYAGGYIGHMDIGSAASVGDKLKLLGSGINLNDVLSVLDVVVSTIEHSHVEGMPGGFNVMASPRINLHNGTYGDAGGKGVSYSGGFAGKISGGHIQDSNCVLFAYIIGEIAAGGYVGEMAPGTVANVLPNDSGTTNSVFDRLLSLPSLAGVASLLEDFVPTIRNSETSCIPCGGAVRAESPSDRTILRGMAGGYVGHCVGGQIWGDSDERWKDDATYGDTSDEPMRYCTAHRIRSVYGREYAGGYAGFVEAGSTADVGSLSVLSGLLNVDNLLGALNATYAKIKRARVTGPLRDIDEQTWNAWKQYIGAYGPFASELYTAAYADLDNYIYGTHVVAGRHKFANYANTFLSGCAGGFVGAMHSGVMKHCEAIDTKLVLGMRAAGGFVGEMQTGDLAKTGGVSLLGQNINLGPTVSNLGSVLVPAVEDSRTEGYSYGLQVGATGSIGIENIGSSTESSGTTPSGTLADGYYLIGPNGWTVNDIDPSQKFEPNPAHTGEYMLTTSLAEGNPVKVVKVEGDAITTWYPDGTGNEYTVDAAHAGRVYIYFTPTSKSEWTAFGGYIYIEKAPTADDEAAFGKPSAAGVGCAGGFVGAAYGGQLTTTGVYQLKRVKGVHAVGGYAGMANSAALVSADTNNTSDGILQNLLDALISNKGGLVDALHATVCTINAAEVESLGDADGYGFVVDGAYEDNGTKYAPYAGGFAGMMQATLVNTKKGSVEEVGGTEIFTPDTEEGTTTVSVKYLRGVNGGHYAGGFVGLASVGSVAQIGGSNTNILSLLNVGNVGLLDIFRTYIYRSTVEGVEEGIRVFAHDWEQPGGSLQGTNVTGAAGGFAGGLMSGTIEDSSTTNLNYVEAPNYAAGYCGHSGTKSVLNLSGASVDSSSALGQLLTSLGLDLSTSLQLMNIIGSTFKRDTVTGFGTSNDGFIVKATETQTETSLGVNSQFISGSCAAGFAGYADIAQIEDNCQALKIRKIIGPQIAGGFVGRTSVSFLAEANVSDSLVRLLTTIVRELLRILGINALSNLGLVDLGLNDPSNPLRELLGLELLNDGKLVQINLFGLVIAVAIAGTDNSDPPKPTLVTITIGSSTISLPVNPDGTIDDSHLQLQLIELNRTAIRNGLAQGIDDGYDVFGNGADQNSSGDPDGVLGYSGGFIGLNDHGFVSNSETQYCDTVRGAANKTGPFVGGTLYNQNAQGPDRLEENSNNYHIYRGTGATYSVTGAAQTAETVGSTAYNRYRLAHLGNVSTSENADMAYLNTNETAAAELLARQSNQKFVGMLDAALADNPAGLIPMPGEMKDPCDTEMKITLQKVWDDEDNLHNRRPNHVNFTIAVVEAGHTPPANVVVAGRPPHGATVVETKTYTLYPGDTFSNTWPEKVVTNLNHGTAGPDPNDASATMYYQFYVYETEHYQASYSVSYAVDEWAATVIATNTDWLLPETGGVGTTVFVILGVALLIAGALMAAAFWINRRKGGPSTRFGRR